MSEPQPPRQGGAHRAPPAARGAIRSLVPSVLAVVAVGALLVLLIEFFGKAPDGSPTVALPTRPSLTSTAATTPPPVVQSRPTAPSSPTGAPPATVPVAPVLVLNNSRVRGLAARAAADLRAGGWPVSGTGNFTGRIAETTAYYPPGGEASARALAQQFPKILRVLPRFDGLPGSGLTLVVTRDYAG